MTDALGNAVVNAVPRLYGASELGILDVVAHGDAHPRVEYIGGELFVGLVGADGAVVTEGAAEEWRTPFRDALTSAEPVATQLPDADDGLILVEDEATAAAVLVRSSDLGTGTDRGAPVVFAFARDTLVIVDADDEAAMGRALDIAEGLYSAGGPLVSAHPVILVDGKWAPFSWGELSSSLTMRFEQVLRLFSVRAYEAQTAALNHPGVHLADAKIRVLESGVTTTFATWPKGTATLLPVVDNVIVADTAGALSVATLNEFLDAAGDAVVRTDLSPARYFVPGEPPKR